jgi:hypothetical protein
MYSKESKVAPQTNTPAIQEQKGGLGGFIAGLDDDQKKFLANTVANWNQGTQNFGAGMPQTPQHQFQRQQMPMLQQAQQQPMARNNAMSMMLRR